MLEWLQNSDFKGPADTAAVPPRSSLRLNHVEVVSQILADPSFDASDESVPQSIRDIAGNRKRLAEDRRRLAEDRARERVELRFGSFTYTVGSQGRVRIVAYDGCYSVVRIPRSIEGGSVVALASSLFSGHGEIESVLMPDSVERIGHRLFEGCSNLRKVRLSAALAQVGSGTFSHCGEIDEVEVNSPVAAVEGKLLAGSCVSHISFGLQVRAIDPADFSVIGLKSISVDKGNEYLTTDGVALFSRDGKTLVRMVVPRACYEIPAGCEVVGEKAFDSVQTLTSVSLPEGLRVIGRLAFAKTSLREVAFPDSLEVVGDKAFFFCSKLRAANLPRSLRFLGAEAFASSGVESASLPSSLEEFGARAFDKTPVRKSVACGSVTVFPNMGAEGELPRAADAVDTPATGELRIDRCGGVYQGDTFLELFGLMESYHVASGTTRIAAGACKRHETLRSISIPEGVIEVGDDAFRNNRALRVIDLPETLQVVGARAFLDTSVPSLRLGPAVRQIGECALVVQGENPFLGSGRALQVDLDAANRCFYIESGLLCERGGGRSGGDAVVLYLGTESVVRIPEAVTQIDAFAFCGAANVVELYLHARIECICTGAFSSKRTPRMLHLGFAEEVQGVREVHLPMPSYTSRYRSMMPLFETSDRKTRFNFEYYDTWVANSLNTAEFAPAALARLKNPVRLCQRCRDLYEGILTRKALPVCRYFAGKGDLGALVQLHEWGYLTESHMESALASFLGAGEAQATACLLELRKRIMPTFAGIDLRL